MGQTALDANGVKALAALPSLDELRAKIVGLIQAPATKIAQLVNAPAATWRGWCRPTPAKARLNAITGEQ